MELLLAGISPSSIDLVAILFVMIFALNGLSKGFAKLFFKFFGTILSLLLSILLCASVVNFLQNEHGLVSSVAVKLEGALIKIFGESITTTTLEQATSEKLSSMGLGGLFASIIMSFASDASIPTNLTLNQIICPTFAYYIVIVLSVLVLFIIFKILFFLICRFINKLHALKTVATLDRVLGFTLGLLSGIIYLELVIMIIGILPIPFTQNITAQIANTAFVSVVQKINLYKLVFDTISSTNIIEFVKTML
ncbi:MAG: CvpA family protein [Clostridia bacterium]|nr:CvpA family protein [Clostridia bacterium]